MLLGPQTPDATTQVLVVMAAQLSLLTAAIAHHNLTDSQQATLDAAMATNHPTTTTVSTGVLWFIALIFSLGAASISIAVGQWLHHHTDRASSLSRQSVRIWYLRRRGLQTWHVQAIIDILPILLQISLALFLVGLLNLVWNLDYIVAGISTVTISALLLPTLLTALVPYLHADCPYKSRSAWWCFVALNRFTHSRCTTLLAKYGETFGISVSNALSTITRRVISLRGSPAATKSMLSGLRKVFPAIITHITSSSKALVKLLWDHTCKFSFAAIHRSSVLFQVMTHRLIKLRHSCANCMRWRPRIPEAWSKWHSNTLGARNWREFENLLVRTDNTPEEEKLMMLAEADEMIMDDAFLVNVVHPCLQNSSLRSAVPALLRILRHRAHEVTLQHGIWRGDMTVLKWLTSEQDSAAIISMADICIDVIQKYKNPNDRNKDHLVDHLLQLIRAMPLIDPARTVCNRARDLIQWAAIGQMRLREARISELDNGADAWIRAADKDDSLEPFYNMLRKRAEADKTVSNQMTLALGHRALDVLDKAFSGAQEVSTEDQLIILRAVEKACEVGPDGTSIYARLPRLLPGLALSLEALDKLVDIIRRFSGRLRLDIEDIRKLLTFLPHARERLDTKQFLRITFSALDHSLRAARLQPVDFDRVHSDVRGALDVVGKYFSSSGINEVVQADTWTEFMYLLSICMRLTRVDTARPARNGPLFTCDIVNALECCTSRCPGVEFWRDRIIVTMDVIHKTLRYSAGLYIFRVPNEPIAGETVIPAPAPRDVDEAPTEEPQAVDGTPMQ
ncbi:hypothetical protein IEO21_08963 [Rhodonia placenta]|uniref:DUF6535 domain-containing protein n=1 Tax=Rhodonia placenta TaxID=104341 RepID=A0A8H7TYX2_9APHY|nr:hypothetical protein IEO21_08963 [Postia placenta]